MKKNFTRIITLVLAICAITAMAIPSSAASTGGWYVSNGNKATNVVEEVVKTYEFAMNNLDGVVGALSDPHDAWESFIANKESNNWFKDVNKETKRSFDLPINLIESATVWTKGGSVYNTTVWYDCYVYVNDNFGHPTYLCNLDNPYVWSSDDNPHGGIKLTRSDTMYTGTYSDEMKTMIKTWWDTMDELVAYMASNNINTSDWDARHTAEDAFIAYKQNGGTATPSAPAMPSTPTGTSVTVNGSSVTWTDATPFIDANSRTMVPLRAVADAMGLTVNWDAANREASFTGSGKTIYFPIDSTTARTSDGKTVQMDTAAIITDGRTYAPIRYLAEFFDYSVGWNGNTRTVTIAS